MPNEAPLVEVDVSGLTRAEWARIVWGVLVRGSRYTLPPVLVIVATVAIFGLAIAVLAVKVGISPETIEEYEFVFEIAGDILSAVIGLYAFVRNLHALPRLRLGSYRFALVRSGEPPADTGSGADRAPRP